MPVIVPHKAREVLIVKVGDQNVGFCAEDYTLALEKDKAQGTLPRRRRKQEGTTEQASKSEHHCYNDHSGGSFQACLPCILAHSQFGDLKRRETASGKYATIMKSVVKYGRTRTWF